MENQGKYEIDPYEDDLEEDEGCLCFWLVLAAIGYCCYFLSWCHYNIAKLWGGDGNERQ